MKFLGMWNRFMYALSFNVFDVLSWCIVINLFYTTHSYWWFLLYIPTIIFSVHQQRKLEK